MPPRSSLTSQFSIADSNNEVVCPLRNQDGSSCRKRCIGEKRYRSMQEHIRRAHPEHYIQKLPATEESFLLMISTDPSTRVQQQPQSAAVSAPPGFPYDRHAYETSNPGTPRHMDEYGTGSVLPAASAAAALAQLHGHKVEPEWESEIDWHSDTEGRRRPRTSIELPPIHLPPNDITSEPFPAMNSSRPRDILPSILANSPPGRSSTLPPLQRPVAGPNRPRKQSVTKRGREPHHKKQRSRGSTNDWLRRIQNDDRMRLGQDRKALSAEPSADFGKRWEDLIDAADQAASAAGDLDEDRTPVPQSPISIPRASLPPFQHNFPTGNSYQASPLQQALTPPSYNQDNIDPFPSVESGESGENFHIGDRGLSDSSPTFSSQNTQIYCAACQTLSRLKDSYACTECICGLCQACVEVLMGEQGARRKCPRCATIGGRFKPFQLEIR